MRKIGNILDTISITHKFDKKKLIFLNTSDVLGGKILIDSYMNVDELKGQAKKTIKNNDILYSEIRPKNKRYAYVDVLKPEDYVVSTKLMVLRNKTNDVLTKYVYYFLTYDGTLDYLQMRAENRIGSFPQITFDIVKTLELNVPDIATQQKIVDVISSLDNKIELNNRINSELEAMAKTLYDYWFVQFDFPNEQGKPYKSSGGKMIWNEELKREIPEGWEAKTLLDFCNNIGDGIHGTPEYVDNSDYFFINGNNLKNGFIEIDADTKNVSSVEYEKYFIDLNDGTIFLSINGTLGNLAVYTGEKVMLGKSASFINCKGKNRPYCYQFLKLENIQKKFWNIATGSTIKNLSLQSLKNLLIQFPGNALIEKYYDFAKPIDDKRKNIFKENQTLTELRDWLLPMLMNGQVKVEEIEELRMVAEPKGEYGKNN